MKKIISLLILSCAFLSGCEKLDIRFDSRADNDLIHPDAYLTPTSWIKFDLLADASLSDLSFCNDSTGLISGFGGTVYLTRNGGRSWKTIRTNANMTFLAVYSIDERTYLTARRGLYKSTDYGTSWYMTNLSPDVSTFDIWFRDTKTGFLSSGGGTFRSSDAGETWTKICDDIADNMQFTSSNIGYFSYGSTAIVEFPGPNLPPSSGDIYRTSNGGKAWKKMGLKVREINCMSFISDKTGFFATNDGSLYKTTDGGESCILIGKKDFSILDMYFVNEEEGLLCDGKNILLTSDGGETFVTEYTYTGNGMIYKFEFPSPGTGYVIGNEGTILKRVQK